MLRFEEARERLLSLARPLGQERVGHIAFLNAAREGCTHGMLQVGGELEGVIGVAGVGNRRAEQEHDVIAQELIERGVGGVEAAQEH